MPGDRPLSVRELRALYEKGGKAQTPDDFAATARSRKLATIENVNIRLQQIREMRRASRMGLAAQPQVAGQEERALPAVAEAEENFSVIASRRRSFRPPPSAVSTTTVEEIDSLSVAELRKFCQDRGEDTSKILEVGELRQLAHGLLTVPPKSFEIMTDNDYLNSLSIKELKGFIQDHGGSSEGIFEKGQLRALARQLDQAQKDMFSDAHFFFPELAAALATGDDQVINRAVLLALFQENAPERLGEVDTLLEEFKGREDELYDQLLAEFETEMERTVPASATNRVVFVIPLSETQKNPQPASSSGAATAAAGSENGAATRRPSLITSGMRRPSGIWRVGELERLDQELKQKEALERERTEEAEGGSSS